MRNLQRALLGCCEGGRYSVNLQGKAGNLQQVNA